MKGIQMLVEVIRPIDEEAADWIASKYWATDTTSLKALMYWDGTPQGHPYWKRIHLKLVKIYGERYAKKFTEFMEE